MDIRKIEKIDIRKAILHILNNQDEFIKESDYTLELNDKINKFLKKHILKSLHDDKTRAAKFINESNSVKKNCNDITISF